MITLSRPEAARCACAVLCCAVLSILRIVSHIDAHHRRPSPPTIRRRRRCPRNPCLPNTAFWSVGASSRPTPALSFASACSLARPALASGPAKADSARRDVALYLTFDAQSCRFAVTALSLHHHHQSLAFAHQPEPSRAHVARSVSPRPRLRRPPCLAIPWRQK